MDFRACFTATDPTSTRDRAPDDAHESLLKAELLELQTELFGVGGGFVMAGAGAAADSSDAPPSKVVPLSTKSVCALSYEGRVAEMHAAKTQVGHRT